MFQPSVSDPESSIYTASRAKEVLRKLLTIRKFEEKSVEIYQQGLMGGSLHGYIGQEAVAVGVCESLRNDDYITMTYRSRGQAIAKGAIPEKLFAEMMGRASGYCKGKGGPMHITDLSTGILGANAIVGAGIPIATGAAFAAKMKRTGQVAATFFGDGATNQGVFHETLNMASIWNLPIVFICENNLYSEMTPIKHTTSNEYLSERAAAYRMKAVVVDGNDVEAVSEIAREAVERARAGGGPSFIEAMTYRQHGHMFGDSEVYRTKEEVNEWKTTRDPIIRYTAKLIRLKLLNEQELDALESEVADHIEYAYQTALNSAVPDNREIYSDVF